MVKKEKGDRKMYSTVIEIKKDVTSDVLSQLKIVIENAFSNRVGTVQNISKKPRCFKFTSGEKERGCLEIGLLTLKEEKFFLSNVSSWQWIDDEEPDEGCDILEEFSIVSR